LAQLSGRDVPEGKELDITQVKRSTPRWLLFRRWARKVDLSAKLELAFALISVVTGLVAYTLLSKPSDPLNHTTQPSVTLLLTLTLLPILGLGALIGRRLVILWAERRKGSAGSRLHGRVVLLFSAIAIVPTLLVGIASSLLFEFGLQVWFSDRVQTVLDNAATVAEAYVEEHREVIRQDLERMAKDLNSQPFLEQNRDLLQRYVIRQALTRDLSEAIVFDSSMRVLARHELGVSVGTKGLASRDFQRAVNGEIVILSDGESRTDRVDALVKLENYLDAYLYVSRLVDPRVINHYNATQTALSEYQQLEAQRSTAQIRYNIVLMLVALAILLAAILVALWFATRMISPISNLAHAAERIREGDLSARVPVRGAMDELGTLSRAFNRMTTQLQVQTGALVSANEELALRQRFTATVLEGVSAGVLGLDADGHINLANRSALDLLRTTNEELIGKPVLDSIPELGPLMEEIRKGQIGYAQGRVNLMRDGQIQNLAVQLSAEFEKNAIAGYVATFDDITEQLADQRRAAWADVARRIAHEIKNPLTPIQLSAERLLRKYGKEVHTDPQIFSQCTDTIIRQVGDLRRIVDEFSSFARMPAPILHEEDLFDTIKQAIFLQEVANPEIDFSLEFDGEELPLAFDRRLMSQALTNVVKNASESIMQRMQEERDAGKRPQKGQIYTLLSTEGQFAKIIIRDNGRGLPSDIKDRLFEPYVTTRTKGTGLGLAIVKKIIEDHSGQLMLKDCPNGGAEAIIQLDMVALQIRFEESGEDEQEQVNREETLQNKV
jgi:two-component system nitrogen regulation sensor histidine kinase NtrY